MSLNQLGSKKQFAILITFVVILLGLYTQFRMLPAIDDVGKLSKQLKADENLLKNPKVPEEPSEDIEDLKDVVADLDVELEQLIQQSSSLAKKLPEVDSQDLMVKISDLARSSRVRIVNNVPFLAKKRMKVAGRAATSKSNKKLSIVERRKQERRMRKAMKRTRKRTAQKGVSVGGGIGVYTREGELMDKLVNDFDVSRPLHKLKIEGTYNNIKAFIEALQGLPWQVTVVKIDYKLLGANTAQGYSQPLMVEMIIGA